MVADQAHCYKQLPPPSFTFSHVDSQPQRHYTPRTISTVAMNGAELSRAETMEEDMWTTPTSQPRPRPATIHEGFSFCTSEDFSSLCSWDSSSFSLQQTPSETMSRPISMHQDQYPTGLDNCELHQAQAWHNADLGLAAWAQKPPEDHWDLQSIDADMALGNSYTPDDIIPILDLYQDPMPDGEPATFDGNANPRRMSGSSFTVSTSGGLSDMPSYEDFSAALSEAQSFGSDYPPTSNRTSLMSSTQLSPVASPRIAPQTRTELVRTQSRGRGGPSQSPRPGMRSAPYSVEGGRVAKRWSTGSYGNMPNRKPASFTYHPLPETYGAHQRLSSRHSSPTAAAVPLPLNFGNLQAAQQAPFMMANPTMYQRSNLLLPSQLPSQVPQVVPSQALCPETTHFGAPAPLLSHGLFRMLQSNADPHSLHGHYTDLSDPPDLYATLLEEQIPPPPEDLNPEDPDLIPHEQDLRFEGDLYTPRWVRGHGNKREGWCGICKPGRWLVLKNSAFWYDKSFTHGISAATGNAFQEPQQKRRMDGSPDVWEGLCGSCNDWIPLVSSKKKGTTWFRHAYKCHTHPKVKDVPKRRRESNHTRALAASTMGKAKYEHSPVTPQMAPVSTSMATTPTPTSMPLVNPHPQPQQDSTPMPPSQSQLPLHMSPEKLLSSPTEPFPDMI